MATDIKTIKLYIEEQRRYHDELTLSNRSMRGRIITFIGATVALLAFLYAGALDTSKSTLERLFIPQELYGKIFYFFGLFLVMYALGKLVHGARPNGVWFVAIDSKDVKLVESMSEEDYLIKLKNDYESAREFNIRQHEKRSDSLKDAFFPLLLGAILLIVLRYFQ